jgi:hypothetical protein
MLNPSTADENANDPTTRRVCGFSRAWGYKRVEIRNLFAYRATDPKDMVAALGRGADIIGPGNNEATRSAVESSQRIMVAWGAHKLAAGLRGRFVFWTFVHPKSAFCLGEKDGHPTPKHPLYVAANFVPLEYRP